MVIEFNYTTKKLVKLQKYTVLNTSINCDVFIVNQLLCYYGSQPAFKR